MMPAQWPFLAMGLTEVRSSAAARMAGERLILGTSNPRPLWVAAELEENRARLGEDPLQVGLVGLGSIGTIVAEARSLW